MAPRQPTWLAETIVRSILSPISSNRALTEALFATIMQLAEDGERYLIQWAGVDGAGEAWEPTWEPRKNANAALVSAWKKGDDLKPTVAKLEAKAEEIETKLHLARASEREAGPELPPDLPLHARLSKPEQERATEVKRHLAESSNGNPHNPPSLRSLTFPPEVLSHILFYASDAYFGDNYTDLEDRNAGLASLALVSKAFRAATYSVLYGDLRLAWMADKVKKLRKSFKKNPNLLPLVRRLEATAIHEDEWIEYQLENPGDDADDLKRSWFDDYCEREGIEEDSHQWWRMMEDGLEDGVAGNEWAEDMRSDAGDAWDQKGHGGWKGKGNVEGALDLLDIVESAPALRSVVVCEFSDAIQATDIATRGPYPLIESLEASRSSPSPFFVTRTLASLLASASPNLRSLSGYIGYPSDKAPIISLPPFLTQLEISGYDRTDPRIETLLLQVQPSLRSLTLAPSSAGWASSSPAVTTLLSSLETIVVRGYGPIHHKDDIDALAHALAPTSLRHLEGVPATATLIAALPLSLQSITLRLPPAYASRPRLEMERVLELMKAAATRPLRVEFLAASRMQGREAWDEYRDSYAAMGHTLSVRY